MRTTDSFLRGVLSQHGINVTGAYTFILKSLTEPTLLICSSTILYNRFGFGVKVESMSYDWI